VCHKEETEMTHFCIVIIPFLQLSTEMLADTVCETVLFLLHTLKECAYKIFLGYTVLFKTLKMCTVFAGK